MSMCKCPKCGEMYSTSYKTCPFCEEDEAWAEGRPIGRKGNGRRVASRKDPSILGPLLVVVILILVGILVYFLFGDKIATTLGLGQGQTTPPSSMVEPPAVTPPSTGDDEDSSAEPDTPDIVPPSVGDETGTNGGQTGTPGTTAKPDTGMTFEEVAKLPKTLTLNKTDFTRDVSEGTIQLTVKDGGTGYSWISEDEGVASVDANGVVTPISKGDIRVMAYTETGMGSCIVRVRGGAAKPNTAAPSTGGSTLAPSTGTSTATLNKIDFTLPVNDPPVQLKVSGSTAAVTWSVDKPGVATVSNSGLVTAVAKGTAIVTATVDGKALTCIVRVK